MDERYENGLSVQFHFCFANFVMLKHAPLTIILAVLLVFTAVSAARGAKSTKKTPHSVYNM